MKSKCNRIIIIVCLCVICGLMGCDVKKKKKEESIPNQFETIIVSDDFLINDECKQLTTEVVSYLGWIQHYYNHSDKEKFDSFEFSDSKCIKTVENIESHKNDKVSITEESLIKIKLVGYYLKMQYIFSEKDLLEAAGNTRSEDWFAELSTELDNIFSELSNGYK